MHKLTGFGVAVAMAVALAIVAKSFVFNTPVQAEPEAAAGISPYALHLQTDVSKLPELETGDLI